MKKVILAIVFILWGIGFIFVMKDKIEENERNNRRYDILYSSQRATEVTRSAEKVTTASRNYISGTFPVEGYYATREAIDSWMYDGKITKEIYGKTEKLDKYETSRKEGDYYQHYVINLNSDRKIVYVGKGSKSPVKKSTPKSTTKASDPFHVDEFSNAEDFYDWYYDDFFDYEEAEDYYREHKQ